jgi:hypothetical protein
VRDRPGFAGAGSGEHAHRAVERGGDLALLGVETLEEQLGTHVWLSSLRQRDGDSPG